MTKAKKIFGTAVVVLVALLLVAVCAGSVYMLNFSLSNKGHADLFGQKMEREFGRYPEVAQWYDSLGRAGALRDTFITMRTGERAHALFVRASKEENPMAEGADNAARTGKTAICVHGYTDCLADMLHIARIYERAGYNILLPDLHGHGLSDGNDIQMGWKDRLDVLEWAKVADEIFRDSTGTTRQVIHGVSMGAATTMCVSGEDTPGYIRCFVEDCGYTSVWDEFSGELRTLFGLPEFPMMHATSLLCKLVHGWGFKEASPLKQVAKCSKPMLFIHGDNDSYVPTDMVYPLYDAKPGEKELWLAPGSKHAVSYMDHKAEYTRRVLEFTEKHLDR